MRLKRKQYTKSDLAIMLFVVVPWILDLNRLIVGAFYFLDISIFLAATLITFSVLRVSWLLHSWIGAVLRDRFPQEGQTSIRLAFAIPLFILITALIITLLFWGYDRFNFPGAVFDTDNYRVCLLIGSSINLFVTFVHEAVTRFEKWRLVLIRNEQLKKEYMQSQLLGLKSQINPHFLFNSLNSLSSLINEDEQEAEAFLDQMSKVYRYLLRNHEELVPLQTEIDFIQSFFYLLKTRYGRAIELHIAISDADANRCLPPLTLQMLLEDVFNTNAGTREQPVAIRIAVIGDELEIRNNIQRKLTEETVPSGNLENISNKFWLLCQKRVVVTETNGERIICLPLITEKRKAA